MITYKEENVYDKKSIKKSRSAKKEDNKQVFNTSMKKWKT